MNPRGAAYEAGLWQLVLVAQMRSQPGSSQIRC